MNKQDELDKLIKDIQEGRAKIISMTFGEATGRHVVANEWKGIWPNPDG